MSEYKREEEVSGAVAEETVGGTFIRDDGSTGHEGDNRTVSGHLQGTKWYAGSQPTQKEVYARIGNIYAQDPERGKKLAQDFLTLQNTPTSKYYNAYSGITNKSVKNLQAYGIDTSKIDDEFFTKNDFLRQYLRYDGTTNTPSQPTKKSSAAEKAAYEYYQIWKAEDTTRKAEDEWNRLKKEVSYWTQRSDRNLSDEEILTKINWDNYKTLSSLDGNAAFQPVELNRVIGYSRDNLYGVIWAARNGGGTGDWFSDNINYALGAGNQWVENKELSSKLLAGSDTWSPYEVGSTMEKQGLYFGVDHFDQKWVDDNRQEILSGGDDTAKQYFSDVVDALRFTDDCNAELDDMLKYIDEMIDSFDADYIIDLIFDDPKSKSLYKNLFSLDESLKTGKLKDTTSAVKYRRADIEKLIREKYSARVATESNTEFTDNVVGGMNEETDAVSGAAPVVKVPEVSGETPQEMATPTPKPEATPTPTPAPKEPVYCLSGDIPGLIQKGNIDLNSRFVVHNPDGSISTERSITVEFDGHEVLLPTIVDGKEVTEDEAVQHYKETGEHLGIFDTPENANTYAKNLSSRQGDYYLRESSMPVATPTVAPPPETAVTPGPAGVPVATQVPATTQQPVNTPRPSSTPMDVPKETPKPTAKPKTTESVLDAQDRKNIEAVTPTVMAHGTDEEKAVFQTARTSNFDGMADQIANAPANENACTNGMIRNSQEYVAKRYFPAIRTINDYEQAEKELKELQERRQYAGHKYTSYEARMRATGGVNAFDAPVINSIIEDPNWAEVKSQITSDDPNEQYAGYGYLYSKLADNGIFSGSFMNLGVGMANGQLTGIPEQLKDYADKAVNGGVVNESKLKPLTVQEEEYMGLWKDEMDELDVQIADLQDKLNKGNFAYKEAVALKKQMLNDYALTDEFVSENGKGVDKQLPKDMDALYSAMKEYTPTTWSPTTLYDSYIAEGKADKESCLIMAGKDIRVAKEELQRLERSYKVANDYGLALSDEERRNIEQRMNVLRRQINSAGYFLVEEDPNFDAIAESAMKAGAKDDMSSLTKDNVKALLTGEFFSDFVFGGLGVANALGSVTDFHRQFMEHDPQNQDDYKDWQGRIADMLRSITPDEKKRYFYLLSEEGEDAANDYFASLADPIYGSLSVRASELMKEELKNFAAQNGWTSALSYAASFLTNVAGNAQSWMTEKMHQIEGIEDNPYGVGHLATEVTQDLREGVMDTIKAAAPGLDEGVIDFFFNAITSAGDSTINALLTSNAFDMISEAIPVVSKLANFVSSASEGAYGKIAKFGANFMSDLAHALPMGMGAAAKAYRDAVVSGADPDQAKALYRSTLWAESVSEALTYGNIKSMFEKGATDEIKGFITALMKNGFEEAAGEGFNQWWEDTAERTIMGEKDKYNEMFDYYYKELKLPKGIAEEMVAGEMTKSILLAAASGFVSSMFSSTTAYARGTASQKAYKNALEQEVAVDNWRLTTSKDLNILGNANNNGNNTQSAASISAVIRVAGVDPVQADAASQHMITNIAEGSKATAVSAMKGVVFASGEVQNEAKEAVSYAALTDGEGNKVLRDITEKAKNGERITREDVDNLIEATNNDKTGPNAEANEDTLAKTILENRKASKVRNKLAAPEVVKELKANEDKVKSAQRTQENLDKIAEQRQADVEIATQNASDALGELAETGDKEALGPVEQTNNEVRSAVEEAQDAQAQAEAQEKITKQVEDEANQATNAKLTEIREEASAEVEQEVAQEQLTAEEQEKQEIDDALEAYHPTKKLKKPIKLKTLDGKSVTIIGIFGKDQSITDEFADPFIYATTNGYVHGRDINWDNAGNMPDYYYTAQNYFDSHKNPVDPVAWFTRSVKGTDNSGNEVDVVGIAGQSNGSPVVMDSNGKTYDSFSQIELDPDSADVMWDTFEAVGEDKFPEITLEESTASQFVTPQEQQATEEAVEEPATEEAVEAPEEQKPSYPEGFIAYPGGPVKVIAFGKEMNVVGIAKSDGPLMYVDDAGVPFDSQLVDDEPADFGQWVNENYESLYDEEEDFGEPPEEGYTEFYFEDDETAMPEEEESEIELIPDNGGDLFVPNMKGYKLSAPVNAIIEGDPMRVDGVYFGPEDDKIFVHATWSDTGVGAMGGIFSVSKVDFENDGDEEIIDKAVTKHMQGDFGKGPVELTVATDTPDGMTGYKLSSPVGATVNGKHIDVDGIYFNKSDTPHVKAGDETYFVGDVTFDNEAGQKAFEDALDKQTDAFVKKVWGEPSNNVEYADIHGLNNVLTPKNRAIPKSKDSVVFQGLYVDDQNSVRIVTNKGQYTPEEAKTIDAQNKGEFADWASKTYMNLAKADHGRSARHESIDLLRNFVKTVQRSEQSSDTETAQDTEDFKYTVVDGLNDVITPNNVNTEPADENEIAYKGLHVDENGNINIVTDVGEVPLISILSSQTPSNGENFLLWALGQSEPLLHPTQGNAATPESINELSAVVGNKVLGLPMPNTMPESTTEETTVEAEPQEEKKNYTLKNIPGIPNKAMVSPIIGILDDGRQVSGIVFDSDGDLTYVPVGGGGLIKVSAYDIANKPFAEWALDAISKAGQTGNISPGEIATAQDQLNYKLQFATDDTSDVNPEFSEESDQLGDDLLNSKSLGKTKETTDGTTLYLYDWQDPSKHGAVRDVEKREKPKTKKFKKWQDLEHMYFFNASGKSVSQHTGQKYFLDADGNPKVYYRGYGGMHSYLWVVHESPSSEENGYDGPISFYMDKLSTAKSYAGTSKITDLRYIDNWETAKAAMQDIGLDLVTCYDPNGSGEPGYKVVTKYGNAADTRLGEFFTEDQLAKFRNTYGGAPRHTGIHAGYLTGNKILVLKGHGANYTQVVANVTFPDGYVLQGTHKTRVWAETAFAHGYDTVVFDGVRDNASGGGEVGVEICTSSGPQFKSIYNKGSYSKTDPNTLALRADPRSAAAMRKALKDPEIFKPTGELLSIGFRNLIDDLRYGKPLEEMNDEEKQELYERMMMLPEVQYGIKHKNTLNTLPFAVTGAVKNFMRGKGDITSLQNAKVPQVAIDLLTKGGVEYVDVIESMFTPEAVEEQHRVRDAMVKRGSFSGVVDGKETFNGAVAQGKRLDVLLGLPASGKSTLGNTLSRMYKSRFLDSDVAKELHKDYSGGANSGPLHNESRFITDQAQGMMIANGDNVILPLVGHKFSSVQSQLEAFKKAGYDIHLHRVEIPWSEAVARVMNRLATTGRYLDVEYIMGMDGGVSPANIENTFNQLVKEGYANGYAVWDNDVEKGQLPNPVEYSSEAEAALDAGRLPESGGYRRTGVDDGRGNESSSSEDGYQALRVTSQKQTPTQKQQKKVKSKLHSPQRIAHDLAKSLGFGDYIGSNNFGNRSSQERGYWDRHAELLAVKNKDMGDYTATFHEIGHGIAQRLGLTGTDYMVRQLVKANPSFEDNYKQSELRAEAIAEFVWRYMEDEQGARDFAGDTFYDMFERELLKDPGMTKSVWDARSKLQQFIGASLGAKMDSIVHWEQTGERPKYRDMIRNAINKMVDTTSTAEDVDAFVGQETGKRSNLRRTALFAGHAMKRAMTNLTDFLTDANGQIIGDGMAKRISDTGFKGTEENIHLLEKYLLYKHSIERDEQGKPVFDTSISLKAREAEIKRIERDRKDIVEAAKAWESFRHDFLQAWMVDTGFWSQELLDKLEDTYHWYVPTFRIRDESGNKSDVGFRGGKKYSMHRATGGSEDIYSPYYSFIGMVNQITEMVANNQTAQEFDRLYNEVEGMGVFARRIPGPVTSPAVTMENRVSELLEGQVNEDLMEQVLSLVKTNPALNQKQEASNVLTVHRQNGQVVQYEVDNPEMLKMLSGMSQKQTNLFFQTVGKLVRTMSMLTTGSNPLFAMRNAVRDFQNSVNYGTWASNYGTGALKWLKAFYEVWKESDDYNQYRAMGGGGWTRIDQNNVKSMRGVQEEMFGADLSNVGKTAKWAAKKVWDTITMERLNEIIEQASRFAEYKYGKHNRNTLEGRQEAFQAAQDVTVDFSRKGDSQLADMLRKTVPFFNASLQGVYRTGRQLTEAERGRIGTRLTKTVLNSALASLLSVGLTLMFGDDDDKEEFEMLSDDVKSKHLIILNPLRNQPGQPAYLRIPLAQDPLTYAIHGAVTNMAWNGAEDEIGIGLTAIADTILDNLNPLGSGTIAQPYLDASHNRTWYGSNLVRSMMLDWVDPTGQYNEDTPEVFKWLGNLTNQSPEIIEYLVQQYTGFLGTLAIPAMSAGADEDIDFEKVMSSLKQTAIKKWTTDPTMSTDITQNFYNMANELSTITGEAEQDRPQGLLLRSLGEEGATRAYEEAKAMIAKDGLIYNTKNVIKEGYAKIDSINANKTLTDEQKADETKKVRLQMLRQVQAANEQLEEYRKKYITGETLTDRIFGGLSKRFKYGDYAHVKTDTEKLPDIFQNDLKIASENPDGGNDYINKCMEVYNGAIGSGLGGGKSEALPHPSQKYTITDRKTGTKRDITISDDEWDKYTEVYRDKYRDYLTRSSKARRWKTLTDLEKYDLLKAAARTANDYMKKLYNKEHGIQAK